MAESERDGSCSCGDEDDMSGLHSLSASEDSVEVQVIPISLRNKRKLAEPRKIQEPSTAPLKKRRFEQIEETIVADEESRPARSPSPFRPWSSSTSKSNDTKKATSPSTSTLNSNTLPTILSSTSTSISTQDIERELEEDTKRRKEITRIEEEELLRRLRDVSNRSPNSTIQICGNLVSRRETRQRFEQSTPRSSSPIPPTSGIVIPPHLKLQEEPLALVLRGEIPRVPSHPAVSGTYERAPSSYPLDHQESHHSHHHRHHHHHHHHPHQNHPIPPHRQQSHQASTTQLTNHSRHLQGTASGGGTGQQRNYKNMTRERRIEANARERTRVHTISAAFETLRRTIPAYSHNQKLSKLSVLRIACSYIATLTKIMNIPDGQPIIGQSLGECVNHVSETIQTEGKLRKRKGD
ncbi:PREDICTED: protein disconnected-like isoform X2 [Polistes dominula]|nr:PREDICTED: protein disconnected-like isoform X2 [Polistes dominula]XP_015177680.1 PREDICTED: protein disconnected-like isoform X2 [Polistes dominula]XP_015177681.1 PREDICTED: protein disconnected-like isoform X2 [Polistes dominula]